jgi:ABC-type lipoprotein release transport system permease subunit
LGMTRRNVRTILNSQGTAIGLLGPVAGILVGRLGWRAITERVPPFGDPAFALVAALLLIPATLIAANVLALWSGPSLSTMSETPSASLY